MWITFLKLVGSPKVLLTVALVSAVGLTSWILIQYGEDKATTRVIQEQNQNYIDTRKRIDNAASRAGSDVDSARSRLQQRQVDK
jgi:hypothetical protein